MQHLRDIAEQVATLHVEMANAFSAYQQATGLTCRPGCGQCCLHPGVEATILEMLPLALKLLDTGKAEETHNALLEHELPHCFFYQPHSADGALGQCGIYPFRGSICRMFGAAGYPDKHQQAGLSVCKIIKSDNEENLGKTLKTLEQSPPPIMKHWKERLRAIDYALGQKDMPISLAARLALEKVLMMSQYE